jgi:PIN domain nuclease of toxin-antitoxin system
MGSIRGGFYRLILLDTHAALWVEIAPEKLSQKARARLHDAEDAGESIAISCMTLWEIAYKNTRNRLELFVPCRQFLTELEADFVVLPVDRQVAMYAARFGDLFPKDPMDRLIAGTALANDLTLITGDDKILQANVCKLLW